MSPLMISVASGFQGGRAWAAALDYGLADQVAPSGTDFYYIKM